MFTQYARLKDLKLQTELRIITNDLLDPAIVAEIEARLAAELAEKLAAEHAAECSLIAPEAVTLDMIVTPDFYYCILPRGPLVSFINIVNNILIEVKKVEPDDLQRLVDDNPAMKLLAAQFCDRAADRCDKKGLLADAKAHRERGQMLLSMSARSALKGAMANIESENETETE